MVSRRRGREKLHYLNPVPIRLIHDRWVSKYTEPWAAGLAGLKTELEQAMEKVFEIYIRTTPERLWEAITDPAIRAKYHFGAGRRVRLDTGIALRAGAPGARRPLAEGENLVVEPPRRLVQTHAHPVERGRRTGGHVASDLGDRTRRRLVPADRDPRPAQRRRTARALRRLADDLVRLEDLAGDRPDPHHPRLADVRRAPATQGGTTMPTDHHHRRPHGRRSTSPTRTTPSRSTSTPSASRSGSTPRSARPCDGSRSPRRRDHLDRAQRRRRQPTDARRRHRHSVHGARRRGRARRDARTRRRTSATSCAGTVSRRCTPSTTPTATGSTSSRRCR